jgi:peptide/nickel transport system permease protein
VIPALPIIIIFLGTTSPEYVIKGTLNMSITQETSPWELYLQAIKNLVTFNLGTSISSGQPVIDEIWAGFNQSFKIIIPALLFSYLLGTLIGILKRDKNTSNGKQLDFIFYIPMIVFSYLFLFMSDKLGIDFTSGIKFVYAIIILSVYPVFVVYKSFYTRYHTIIESDFYKFHISTGLDKKHIFKKFLIKYFGLEYLSFFENLVIYMFGFIYFVESPFAINGMGNKFVLGIQRFDYPLIIGFCIISIILFSVINIIVEFIKLRIDPRQI